MDTEREVGPDPGPGPSPPLGSRARGSTGPPRTLDSTTEGGREYRRWNTRAARTEPYHTFGSHVCVDMFHCRCHARRHTLPSWTQATAKVRHEDARRPMPTGARKSNTDSSTTSGTRVRSLADGRSPPPQAPAGLPPPANPGRAGDRQGDPGSVTLGGPMSAPMATPAPNTGKVVRDRAARPMLWGQWAGCTAGTAGGWEGRGPHAKLQPAPTPGGAMGAGRWATTRTGDRLRWRLRGNVREYPTEGVGDSSGRAAS